MNTAPTSRDRTTRTHQTLCANGLRPVRLRLPDTSTPEFAAEARRQCARINAADRAEAMMDWLEQVSVFDDDALRPRHAQPEGRSQFSRNRPSTRANSPSLSVTIV